MLVPTTVLTDPGSGGAGAVTLIQEIDLSSTTAFTSIPGTYNDLRFVMVARGTASAATVVGNIRFNSDSGANYESNLLNVTNNSSSSAATAAQTEGVIDVFPANTAVANRAGIAIIDIPEYSSTSFHKICISTSHTIYDTAASNYVSQYRTFQWRSTSAITRIDVTISSGAWASGSVARLYGIT